jgi:hypothetical protein
MASTSGGQSLQACQAFMAAAREGDVGALERMLGVEPDGQPRDGSSASDLESMHRALLMSADEEGMSALMHAASNGHVHVLRLLLDHPCADPAGMMMLAKKRCWYSFTITGGYIALMFAAAHGHVAAMRLLLGHPSADPAAMVAVVTPEGRSALVAAAQFAVGTYPSTSGTPPRSCAPLLLLLRRVAVESQPSDDQQAHMSKVMEALCPHSGPHAHGPRSNEMFGIDRPDDVRDECVRLLLEFRARGF